MKTFDESEALKAALDTAFARAQSSPTMNFQATQALIVKIGGPALVGSICGVTRQAVVQWSKIPAEYVLTIAKNSPVAITPHEIRRDLYPHPLDGMRSALAGRIVRARRRRPANGKPRD